MSDYDLSRLGSRAFEQMVTALSRTEIGSGVQVFGDGPDGGREATFEGRINWSATAAGGDHATDGWDGFTVFQAKYQVKRGRSPRDDAVWLQREITKEINSWVAAASEQKRARLPEYLIFVTNVDLSAMPQSGGIDRLESVLRKQLTDQATLRSGLHVRDFRIWHADQIQAMLRSNESVRRAFPALLSAGDILAMLGFDALGDFALSVGGPIRDHVVKELGYDSWIRLGQAGAAGDPRIALGSVVVDVPANIDEPTGAAVMAVQRVLSIGDMVLRPKQPDRVARPSVVIVGGPGQGKSTLGQLIAQAYRSALLQEEGNLGPTAQETVHQTAAALKRMGLAVPGNRRWPVRVELAKYAEHLSTGAETSLLRWLSDRLVERGTANIQPGQLASWLRSWPWALILDGLDEVPSRDARRLIYDQVEGLRLEAEDHDADLLVVVATRPYGYEEQLDPNAWEHLHLREFSPSEATAFAAQLVSQRFQEDQPTRAEVERRLSDAVGDPTTARLMTTPLQVTIMSFIVEKYPNLPPSRYSMFNLYFRTVLEREQTKAIALAKFLMTNGQLIQRLHELVGLHLQVQAESAVGAEAVMSPETLRAIAQQLLESTGVSGTELTDDLERLLDAATRRLVLIVPRDDGVGFELRSLQELMAARAIASGPESGVMRALELSGHSPHWRNTWLLAAGHLLELGSHWEGLIDKVLRRMDQNPARLSKLLPDAPLLAAGILQDNLAARRPNFERFLVGRVLQALDVPPDGNATPLITAIRACLKTQSRSVVAQRLKTAREGGPVQRAAIAMLGGASLFASDDDPLTVLPGSGVFAHVDVSPAERMAVRNLWSMRAVRAGDVATASGAAVVIEGQETVGVREYLDRLAEMAPLTEDETTALHRAFFVVSACLVQLVGTNPSTAVPLRYIEQDPAGMLRLLEDQHMVTAIETVLGMVPHSHWAVLSLLAMGLRAPLTRLPVGDELASIVASYDAADPDEDNGQRWA